MSPIGQDIRFAFRNLRKTPTFTAVALASLALGIGANAAIFGLIDQVMLRALPVKNPSELVYFQRQGPISGRVEGDNRFSFPMYRNLRDRNQVFSNLMAFDRASVNVSVNGSTERARSLLVTGNYFETLGLRPALGRLFTAEDDQKPNGHPLVVLTHSYWLRRFGGDRGVAGRSIRINGVPMTVIGVAAPGFTGTEVAWSPDLMVPLMMKAEVTPTYDGLLDPRSMFLQVMGRRKPGVSIAQAQAGIDTLWRPILEEDIKNIPLREDNSRHRLLTEQKIKLVPGDTGTSPLREQFSTPLLVLMGMVGLMLLIACANVANLLLARAANRQKEIAIRVAIGAGRLQIVRQLLVESLLLAIVGGLLGLLIAAWLGTAVLGVIPWDDGMVGLKADPDWRVLAFTLLISTITGVLFGLVPALQATRSEAAATLKDQSAGASAGTHHVRVRRFLVVAQVSLSLLLLIGAGLFTRSLYNLKNLDPGFRSAGILTFSIDPALSGYDRNRAGQFYEQLQERLATIPGVQSVAFADSLLLSGDRTMCTVKVEGYQSREREDMNPDQALVSPNYFATLGSSVLAGREFSPADKRGAPKVAVINEEMARYFFGHENPLGRHFGLGRDDPDIEIVGVVKDGKSETLRDPARRRFYLPYLQGREIGQQTVYLRMAGSTGAILDVARRETAKLDANLPLFSVKSLRAQADESLFIERMVAILSCAFGFLASLLAAIGLYGVMAYIVNSRTREIGIRVALGATRQNVLAIVLKEVAILAIVGMVIAVPIAIGLGRFINALLYGVAATDPATISIAVGVTACVALLAGYSPAARAARVDPIMALRYE